MKSSTFMERFKKYNNHILHHSCHMTAAMCILKMDQEKNSHEIHNKGKSLSKRHACMVTKKSTTTKSSGRYYAANSEQSLLKRCTKVTEKTHHSRIKS